MTTRRRHIVPLTAARFGRWLLVALLTVCLALTPALPGVSAYASDSAASAASSSAANQDEKSDASEAPESSDAQDAQKATGSAESATSSGEGAGESAPSGKTSSSSAVREDATGGSGSGSEQSAQTAESSEDAESAAEESTGEPRISSVTFYCQPVQVSASGTIKSDGERVKCTDSHEPSIGEKNGSVVLQAVIEFEDADGTTRTVEAADADAGLKWKVLEQHDESGNDADRIATAKAADNGSHCQDCLVTANAAGNGSVKLRVTSETYPAWSGETVTVKVTQNEPATLKARSAKSTAALTSTPSASATPVSATLLYRNSLTGSFEIFSGTTAPNEPAHVVASKSGATFDVLISYDDGSTARASEVGLSVQWSLSNNVYAGKTVASIDSSGELTLSGVSSKLVQLNAKVAGLSVDRCPAYINLVSEVEQPSSGSTISSMSLSFDSLDGGTSGTYDATTLSNLSIPAITAASGKLLFTSTVTYLDSTGAKSTATGSTANANLVWQLVAFYDTLGLRSDVLTASATTNSDQSGVLTALRSGNGWAILRCASLDYPEFAGQEILVRIENNEAVDSAVVAANTVTGAQLVYKDDVTGEYKTYAGYSRFTTPTVIDEPYGDVSFDVRLTFEDGSTALAGERGLAVDWRLSGNIDTQRNAAVAQMAADGTLSATRVKNAVVSITGATVNGKAADGTTAYVRITNNGYATPSDSALSISAHSQYWLKAGQSPDDTSQSWRWRSSGSGPTADYTTPLVVSNVTKNSWAQLTASVNWSDGSITTLDSQDHANRSWSIVSSTTLQGASASGLVSLSKSGFLTATGKGSGYVTVRCDVEIPYYDADSNKQYKRASSLYRVAVYASQSYVESVEILNEKGKALQSSLVLPDGKNAYQFQARVTYCEYDGTTGSMEKRVVTVPQDGVQIEGLTWKVYRSEEMAENEDYSMIRQDGSFLAQSGFARAYVYVNIANASFTGKDIGTGVTVIAEDSTESLGLVSTMKVLIYHHSDYEKEGTNAPVAKELTLTRAQLEAVADYTTWYTFQRRGDSFGTIYAHGVTMRALLTLCGVPSNMLESMRFTGNDGVTGIVHSADFILGSQYRYTNYYYHKAAPGLVHGQSVAPMLALSYYLKNNAGYEDSTDISNAGDAGFGMMSTDSTFRIIFGMRGVNVNNANQSIYKVTKIVMVVADNTFPTEDEQEENPKDPDDNPEDDPSGKPNPSDGDDPNADDSGDSGGEASGKENPNNPYHGNKGEGAGTDEKHGGEKAVADDSGEEESGKQDATNDESDIEGGAMGDATDDAVKQMGESLEDSTTVNASDDEASAAYARELREKAPMVVPDAEIDSIWWLLFIAAVVAALVLGGNDYRRRYKNDSSHGEHMHS